jgi:hypothetical protein
MTRLQRRCCAVLLLAAMLGGATAIAQEDGSDWLSGRLLVGYRTVDVGGADRKYKEDINVDDGPYLAHLRFDLSPPGELSEFADRITLDVNDFGGQPFETIDLNVHKFGAYRFSYERRESEYFYEDLILTPDLADPNASTGGDFHHFDFERVRDAVKLDLTISDASKLWLGFDRYTKSGESTTTLDVQRDEFELDKPVDESFYQYAVGYQYSWEKVTLSFEERIRSYDNVVEIFLPGFSEGENAPPDPTSLDFFFLNQPYDLDSNEHVGRLIARPTDRLRIRASASLQDLDLDVEASERSQGIDFTGDPFTTDLTGAGDVERDMSLFDVDVFYLLNDRIGLTAGVYSHELDQDGQMEFGASFNLGTWEIETTGVEAGAEFVLGTDLTLAAGLASETRETTYDQVQDGTLAPQTEETDRTGYYATLSWSPTRAFRLTATAEDNSYDDPFALASPTDRRRVRVRGLYRLPSGLFLSGSYAQSSVDNDDSGWSADSDDLAVRLGYSAPALDLSVGYSFIDLEREIDQLVTGGGRQDLFAIFYQADTDFIDGRARFEATDRLTIGADVRVFQNDGSFGLDRSDYRGYVELALAPAYVLHLGYRSIDYDEDEFDFDDYDANLAELAFGYRY